MLMVTLGAFSVPEVGSVCLSVVHELDVFVTSGKKKSGERGPPQFSKNAPRMHAGANENLSIGFPPFPGIAPRVAPRIVVFVLLKS